jgi:hypothetical protein
MLEMEADPDAVPEHPVPPEVPKRSQRKRGEERGRSDDAEKVLKWPFDLDKVAILFLAISVQIFWDNFC